MTPGHMHEADTLGILDPVTSTSLPALTSLPTIAPVTVYCYFHANSRHHFAKRKAMFKKKTDHNSIIMPKNKVIS
jgi:hypothetical protein